MAQKIGLVGRKKFYFLKKFFDTLQIDRKLVIS